MKTILLKLLFMLCAFSCLAQENDLNKYLVDDLDFESFYNSRDKDINEKYIPASLFSASENIQLKEGMVFLKAGANQPAWFKAKTTVLKSQQFTIWMRLKIENETDTVRLLPFNSSNFSFFKSGNLQLAWNYLNEDSKGISVGVSIIANTSSGQLHMAPRSMGVFNSGQWIQIALTKQIEKIPVYRLYYRIEDPGKNTIYWTYAGKIESSNIATSDDYDIGNKDNDWRGFSSYQIDEFKFYNKALNELQLINIWPNFKEIKTYPQHPPGIVIDYCPALTGRFIAGSPSIVKIKKGIFLAKGDDYGPAVGQSELARVYRSDDNGLSWKQISEIEGITWATLFQHNGAVYMMGTSAGHTKGHVVIIKSDDEGYSWSKPVDSVSGLIYSDLSYHTAPVPVITYKGRFWRAMEDERGLAKWKWGKSFRAFIMNAPVDADLLKASSWQRSEFFDYSKAGAGKWFDGWLEGNVVIDKQGNVCDLLRVSMNEGNEKAALINFGQNGKNGHFDGAKDFIDFPGGGTKFHVLYDSISNKYWCLANAVLLKHKETAKSEAMKRNSLALICSNDLRNWSVIKTVLYHPDVSKHAFQYPDFIFDGNDIVFVSRTAYDDVYGGAYRQHDVNYFTFHRIKDFRKIK